MRADKDRAKLLEVAMVFVLDFGDAPGVLTSFNDAPVVGFDIFFGPDHSEGHGGHEGASVVSGGFVVFFHRWSVDLDTLSFNDCSDLEEVSDVFLSRSVEKRTRCL